MGALSQPQPVVASMDFLPGPPVVSMPARTGPDGTGSLPVRRRPRARTPHARAGAMRPSPPAVVPGIRADASRPAPSADA